MPNQANSTDTESELHFGNLLTAIIQNEREHKAESREVEKLRELLTEHENRLTSLDAARIELRSKFPAKDGAEPPPIENCLSVENQKVFFGSSERMIGVSDGEVDFVVTSPPYWNLKKYGEAAEEIGQEPYETYLKRLETVWQECFRVTKKDAILVVNVNSRRREKRFYPLAFDISRSCGAWRLWDVLIWYIPNALPQANYYRERLFDNKFEYLLVFVKGDPEKHTFHKPRVPQKYAVADPRTHKKNQNGRCLGSIIRVPAYRPPNIKQMGYHVAAYPEELAALLVETYTNPGDTVLDPFAGSGTTLKVARHMGRSGIGYELNEAFRPLIHKRIEENWAVPDWRSIDILHSSTMKTGGDAPRKIQFHQSEKSGTGRLFERGEKQNADGDGLDELPEGYLSSI